MIRFCNIILGWLPPKDNMPSKLVIPCYDSSSKLIRLRFRIDEPEPGKERYRISKGSCSHLPFPLGIQTERPVVIVESELDAILVAQEMRGKVGVLGLGTVSLNLTSAVVHYLNEKIPITLISLDNDRSGRMKTDVLKGKLSKAIDWPIPQKYGKDPGEGWKQMAIYQWIESGLNIKI